MQFDYHTKFKEKVNEKAASDHRTSPIGRDRNGLAYWSLKVSLFMSVTLLLNFSTRLAITMQN